MGKYILVLLFISACTIPEKVEEQANKLPSNLYLTVLGIAQDAGFPQAACQKDCCRLVWENHNLRKMVSCLAVVDPNNGQSWLFDATPDFKDQLKLLETTHKSSLAGIFLTHAHIGHYTGLMHLGREVMGTKELPVFAMPQMKAYLENNGPWSQLVRLNNIALQSLKSDSTVAMKNWKVTPLQVPHRDEYSETVGYIMEGDNAKALFIPDINKWQLWDKDIVDYVQQVDYAFLDGSFYQNGEIPGRDMSEIPHPFLVESMDLFKDLSKSDKSKIYFIHFNHTNPVLQENSAARKSVLEAGFRLAEEGMVFSL